MKKMYVLFKLQRKVTSVFRRTINFTVLSLKSFAKSNSSSLDTKYNCVHKNYHNWSHSKYEELWSIEYVAGLNHLFLLILLTACLKASSYFGSPPSSKTAAMVICLGMAWPWASPVQATKTSVHNIDMTMVSDLHHCHSYNSCHWAKSQVRTVTACVWHILASAGCCCSRRYFLNTTLAPPLNN